MTDCFELAPGRMQAREHAEVQWPSGILSLAGKAGPDCITAAAAVALANEPVAPSVAAAEATAATMTATLTVTT